MSSIYRIPLTLEPQPEGGFVVTSSALPELITEGDTVDEALANARDAFNVVLEIYEDNGKPLPPNLLQDAHRGPIQTEQLLPREYGSLPCSYAHHEREPWPLVGLR